MIHPRRKVEGFFYNVPVRCDAVSSNPCAVMLYQAMILIIEVNKYSYVIMTFAC